MTDHGTDTAERGVVASVVVAVHDDDRRCRRLLTRLVDQTMPAGRYEVVVVENGSAELADVNGMAGIVRYLHRPEANTAAARNAGLDAARGRYLLLTDADCVPEADWVERMTAHLAGGTCAAVGGIIGRYCPRTWTQRHAITVVNGQRELSYLPALHLPYVAGANAGFVTELLRQVGGFDNELRSGSDVDVCYQLGLLGHRIAVVTDAVVWHEDRATVAAHFRRFRRYAVYQVRLYAKYKPVSGKRFVFDTYPWRRGATAMAALPGAVGRAARGDSAVGSRAVLQLVEAAGVLCGEIEGAIRFRQPYL